MNPKGPIFSSAIKKLFILLTAVTISAPLNVSAAAITTELGFKTLTDKSTPLNIKKAAESVYEVRIPSADSPEDVTFFDLDGPEFKAFRKKMADLPESSLSKQERTVVEKQIEYCRKEKNEKQCALFLTIERGTAFLAGGDGSYLLTNAHIVNRFLKVAAKNESKSVLDYLKTPQWVPIFLFDHSGELVFDPYSTQPAIVKFGVPSLQAFFSGSSWYGDDSDYVVIQLPKPLGTPLKIAPTRVTGENLYHLGFASCTGCELNPNTTDPELNRDRKDKGNSNGKNLYWNPSGPLFDLATTAEILNAPAKYFEGSHKSNWIFFSSDAQVGMSGGPILNGNGEAVGVFAGSKPIIKKDGSMAVVSRGVRPPEFDSAKSSEK